MYDCGALSIGQFHPDIIAGVSWLDKTQAVQSNTIQHRENSRDSSTTANAWAAHPAAPTPLLTPIYMKGRRRAHKHTRAWCCDGRHDLKQTARRSKHSKEVLSHHTPRHHPRHACTCASQNTLLRVPIHKMPAGRVLDVSYLAQVTSMRCFSDRLEHGVSEQPCWTVESKLSN